MFRFCMLGPQGAVQHHGCCLGPRPEYLLRKPAVHGDGRTNGLIRALPDIDRCARIGRKEVVVVVLLLLLPISILMILIMLIRILLLL